MSRSGNLFIAQTEGTQFTMYAVMRKMGLPLTEEQEKFQAYLESKYPPYYPDKKLKNEDNRQ